MILKATPEQISMMKKLAPNFKPEELMCPCCGVCKMDKKLLTNLQALRNLLARPLIITSGYRCEKHNREIGGTTRSRHLTGQAVDIALNKVATSDKRKYLDGATSLFNGIGIGTNLIHVDVRQSKTFWTYPRHAVEVAKPN